jgi:PEP-CTERM motif
VLRKLSGALAFLLLTTIPAFAGDLTLTLDPPAIQHSLPGGIYQPALCTNSDGSGSCVVFSGTITTGGDESQDYSLNALYITMSPSNPDGGDTYVFDNTYLSDFFGNAFFLSANGPPGLLGPDAGEYSYAGGVFEVDVEPGAPIGDYFGTATLDYTDETDCPISSCTVSAGFEVLVTPEPGAWILAAIGLAALGVRWRKQLEKAG